MNDADKRIRFSLICPLIAIAAIILVERYMITRAIISVGYGEFKVFLKERLIDDLKVRAYERNVEEVGR